MANHSSATARSETPHAFKSISNDSVSDVLKRRAESVMNVSQTTEEKIEALAEMICRAGDEPSVALLVLMAMLQNATDAKALTNIAKHLAFTRCGELNAYNMIDAQITVFEDKLLGVDVVIS